VGVVPRPGRLGYHAWNAWRAHEGMRPSRRRHGDPATTTTAEEAELWRIVMRSLYGEEWEDDHEEEEEKEEEAEDLEEDDAQSRHEMFSVEGGNGSDRARAAESAEPLAIVAARLALQMHVQGDLFDVFGSRAKACG